MKIKEIEIIPYKIPYVTPVKIATGILETADNVLVKIITDDGKIGIGETQPLPIFQGCSETQKSVVQVIKHSYEPVLIGRNPFDIERIMYDLDAAVRGALYAVTAISDALYDLVAKALNIPLYQYLGGLFHNKIEMVWSIGMKSTAEMEDEARRVLKEGYRKIKIKVGSPDPAEDIEHAFAVKKILGKDISFRVDANGGYNFKDAFNVIRALDDLKLEFVEQPLPVWDYEGLSKLSTCVNVPLMADESCNSVQSAFELARRQAVAVFDIKLAKNGGIYHARKIAAIAQAANIPLYAGNQPASSVGAAAAGHFYAATPNVIAGDYNIGPGGWLDGDIVTKPLRLEGAFAVVPKGVGIGVKLDEAKLAKYAVSH